MPSLGRNIYQDFTTIWGEEIWGLTTDFRESLSFDTNHKSTTWVGEIWVKLRHQSHNTDSLSTTFVGPTTLQVRPFLRGGIIRAVLWPYRGKETPQQTVTKNWISETWNTLPKKAKQVEHVSKKIKLQYRLGQNSPGNKKTLSAWHS